jgi:hypothetical protein
MKKVIRIFLTASLMLITYNACEEVSEAPGGIPGMGETPGELEIKEPFVPPEGVSYEVVGGDELKIGDVVSSGSAGLKSGSNGYEGKIYGAGGSFHNDKFRFWIIVKLTFTNISNKNRRITLPEGLVFKVVEKGYQNGVLLQRVIFYVKACSKRTVSILAACVNRGRDGSNANLHYTIPGVTGSEEMWGELLESLKNRKVNIENFIVPSSPNALKSANAEEGLDKYMEIADHLQKMVWTLTNDGKDLSQEQKEYLESIPLLDE